MCAGKAYNHRTYLLIAHGSVVSSDDKANAGIKCVMRLLISGEKTVGLCEWRSRNVVNNLRIALQTHIHTQRENERD